MTRREILAQLYPETFARLSAEGLLNEDGLLNEAGMEDLKERVEKLHELVRKIERLSVGELGA